MERSFRSTIHWDKRISPNNRLYDVPIDESTKLTASIYGPETNHADLIFSTESSYVGPIDAFGFSETGTYTFPHGVVYKGQFSNGMFHGNGTLIYPMGQKVVGFWYNGKLISFKFFFADGLLYYDTDWKYCQMADRRYRIETALNKFQPAPNEYLTNQQPTPEVPDGCYYVGYGFYDTKTKIIVGQNLAEKFMNPEHKSALMMTEGIEIPSKEYEKKIVETSLKSGDDPVGYRPELYEFWASGKETEMLEYRKHFITDTDSSSSSSSHEESESMYMF